MLFYLSIAKHASDILRRKKYNTVSDISSLSKLISGGKESEKVDVSSKSIEKDGGHKNGMQRAAKW